MWGETVDRMLLERRDVTGKAYTLEVPYTLRLKGDRWMAVTEGPYVNKAIAHEVRAFGATMQEAREKLGAAVLNTLKVEVN